jgi:alkylation response protein AidB-like acyl-CoA dehydrogenase
MTIALTSDQRDLAEAVAGFTARHAAVGETRAAFAQIAAGQPQPSWQALVGQGFHAAHLPGWAGGDGAGLVELAVILEQAAFGLFPGPLLPTVLAGQLIAEHAPEPLARRLRPDLVAGATAAAAVSESGLRAVRSGTGWLVNGETAPVLGAAGAQFLVLGARADGGHGARETGGETVWFVLDPGQREQVSLIAAESVDLTRDIARVRLTDARICADQLLPVEPERVRDLAATLFAAEAAGVARWCQQTGLGYVKVREQFGRPVGSFQAIKHKCARLFTSTELVTAAAWDAAVAHGQDPGQFALAAAAAAVIAAPTAVDIGLETVTLLGGIGYTWAHDTHLYWRRAMSLAALLGPRGAWQRRLAALSRATQRRHDLPLADEPAGLRTWAAQTLAEAAALDPGRRRQFLVERGLAAPHYPRPHGIEAGPVAQIVIAQEFERAGLAQPTTVIGEWAAPTILAHGTDEQREAFIGPTLRGEIAWCQLFSEPGAGSDLASLTTSAAKVDGGWRLNGQKVWTSQAAEADWAICLARTDPEVPKHQGISYFLVKMDSPGIDVRPLREANGGYLFNEVFLTDVFVPDSRLVGAPGDGWRLARTTLGNERVTIATGSGHRGQLPSGYLAGLRGPVPAEVLAQAGALTANALAFTAMSQRLLLRQLAGLPPGASAGGLEGSVLKVVSAWNVANLERAALDWYGAESAVLGGPARGYLSVPPQLIGGGTLEIQLNVISERVLGLPR